MTDNHPPIKITGLDHVVLRCTTLDLTLEFYQSVLGCTLERVLEEIGLYQLRAGASLIDLVPIGSELGGEHPGDPERPNMDHFCLKLEDEDWPRIQSHLRANKVECKEPARRYGADDFGLSLYIEDPEGNIVELRAGRAGNSEND